MSRINDALKRVQAAQQPHSRPGNIPQARPTSPEQTTTRGIGLAVPFAFALIALLGLFLLWQIRQKRVAQTQVPAEAPPAAMGSSMPEKASEPAPPVSTSKPATTPAMHEKPIAQTSIARAPVPQPVALPLKPAAPGAPPLKLQAVLFTGQNSSAIINGQTVTTGDSVGDYRVSAIYERSVRLISAKHTNILTLHQ